MMRTVAERNDLDFGKDVKLLSVGKSTELRDYLKNNPNMTKYAVLFCAEDMWHEQVTFETFSSKHTN